MGLRTKFNLLMLLVFLIGLALATAAADYILRQNAREEVLQNARIMMESALGVRRYTVEQIRPLLELQMKRQFMPQSVSAYAASQNFKELHKQFPDYTYKEAALNPTNPQDRASDWEADIIHEFRNNPGHSELISERVTPTGQVLHLSRPLQIQHEGCLQCHGRPEDAPRTMLDIYGSNNGFGWKMNEIIGAQVVTVPMSLPLERARHTLITFVISLTAVFAAIMILMNILLHLMVIRPVRQMEQIVNQVSLGRMDVPEYVKPGKDVISSLSVAVNRLRRSLQNAMKMLEE